MDLVEHQFSDFLRQPNRIVEELQSRDVLLRRRGAPSLRLSRVDRDEARQETLLAVARMLRMLAVHAPESIEPVLLDGFPWAALLPAAARQEFLVELTQVLVATAELQSFAAVHQLMREWKATAEIHADPALAASLRRPVTTPSEARKVSRPKRRR